MRTKDGVATLSDLVRSSPCGCAPTAFPVGEVRGSGGARPHQVPGARAIPAASAPSMPAAPLAPCSRLEQLIQEAVVTVPRALIAETIDLVAVLSGRGSARRLTELARVEGLGPDRRLPRHARRRSSPSSRGRRRCGPHDPACPPPNSKEKTRDPTSAFRAPPPRHDGFCRHAQRDAGARGPRLGLLDAVGSSRSSRSITSSRSKVPSPRSSR